jgi:hypothetical protein
MVSNRPTGHSGTTVHERTRQTAIMRPATGLHENRAAWLWTRTPDAVATTDPRTNRPPDRTVAVLRRSRRQPHQHSRRHPRSAYRPSRLSPQADAKAQIPIAPNQPAASFNPASMRSATPPDTNRTPADLTEPSRFLLEARESTWWVLLAKKATRRSHTYHRRSPSKPEPTEHLDSTPQNGLTFLERVLPNEIRDSFRFRDVILSA